MEDFSSNVASCGGASFSGCIWEVPLDTMDLNEDFNSSHENKKAHFIIKNTFDKIWM